MLTSPYVSFLHRVLGLVASELGLVYIIPWVPWFPLDHSNSITCLFGGKKFCQTQKKKSTLGSYGRKWVRNYLSDSKKSASFKNIHCKGDSINYRTLQEFINAVVEPQI